jgi:hypothetical protein
MASTEEHQQQLPYVPIRFERELVQRANEDEIVTYNAENQEFVCRKVNPELGERIDVLVGDFGKGRTELELRDAGNRLLARYVQRVGTRWEVAMSFRYPEEHDGPLVQVCYVDSTLPFGPKHVRELF